MFGKQIYRYDIIPSTQDVAREWVEKGAEAGTIVTARGMSAGRGRRGRVWYTAPGSNLSLTAIGHAVPRDHVWQLPLVVGMAVADGVQSLAASLKVDLRFPNDIYLQGKKIGGILIETTMARDTTQVIPLIGIGVNVEHAPLPPDVAERATSLQDAGARLSVLEVESAILEHLNRRWQEWESDGIEQLLIGYHAYLDLTARRQFLIDEQSMPCRIVRIFPNGAVLIETETGVQRALHAAQVVLGDD